MISEIIEKWIKGILIDGITGNLSGLFDNVNAKVGEIASDVGSTPQAWNSGIFNMLRSLSETVVLPIAAAILALVMCHELIQMITEKNNMHDFDTSMFFRWIFKSAFAILIAMQGGQLVAGFNKWKDTFHRTVKKGEKGIKILAPAPYKVKQKMEKLDEQGKPILDKDGKPLTEEKTVQIPAFKVVSVFDVSQTEGEPLPSIAVNELSGSVQDYQDFFKALEQSSPLPIGFEDIEGGAHGYFHLLDNRIAIQEGIPIWFTFWMMAFPA